MVVALIDGFDSLTEVVKLLKRSMGFSVLAVSSRPAAMFELIDVPVGYFSLDMTQTERHHIRKVVVSRLPGGRGFGVTQSVIEDTFGSLSDMEEAHLKAITLSFPPHLTIGYCGGRDSRCALTEGISKDILDFISKEQNFTFSVHKEPSGLWGEAPSFLPNAQGITEADFNASNTFGTFKSVILGENDLPLSGWDHNIQRAPWVDFSFSYSHDQYKCFAKAEDLGRADSMMLLNPMKQITWILVSALAAFIFLGLFALKRLGFLSMSTKIWVATSGLAWTMVLAYYSGVQTMFLTAEPQQPFSNIMEAFAKRDDWTFIMVDSEEQFFFNRYPDTSNDPILKKAYEVLMNFRENSVSQEVGLNVLFNKNKGCLVTGVGR